MSGKVYLLGAGPGDPELLTMKAIRVLREADVVLHDDLVSPAIVRLAAPGALIANVGKRCGKKQVTQERINAALVDYAGRGLTVARLKGGDPLIFGRAGEEIEALVEAGIDFEIVPGVTAASCAAAAAGISLTDRRSASSLVFLTGHPGAGKRRNEWPGLASERAVAQSTTVVVYMPGSDYATLRDQLLSAGVRSDAACLLVAGASTGGSNVYRTSLDRLAAAPPLDSPKILIAGDVVSRYRTGAAALAIPSASESRSQPEQFSIGARPKRHDRAPAVASPELS